MSARSRIAAVAASAVIAALALAGCSSSNDDLSRQYGSGTTQNYISGTGAVTEVATDERSAPVDFTTKDTDGDTVSAEELRGKVVVLNFWYAGCPPCRAEAKYLNQVHDQYADDDVVFVGVNVRDEEGTAAAFERTFGVDYPTVLDARDGTVQLALSGQIAPNAVPATIVLDKQGRVAARVLGAIDGKSILQTLVSDELDGKAS
ncbi:MULTISPECIES: TlpA disulfide reductase family protein [unclassified Curtobacterium]|jgi:thiol-disulfide isomerase/thioredoxin|uniref:TlpA family protein disulfide reductase n=1 Tax=unclassified Curtobacterium TaxID=257496 RepID=UPI00052AD0D6|nr:MULTISPECIES: TlpA disulfide reductase family protein [unclassified Curtobacterium]AIV40565.1 alkyl hydroperoxide reductase [Curtobacterium sp. MR_MD2014]MBP1302260.1 thiol-disulfide isomerase/thioredoxin [Curtobacterium sp. 1310]MCM3504395.1 TlpA family protein disulfide reductase [Curtobacterium sp. ODYSSEY 48 V2]MCM3520228.1 TlpA family protein disulfide reductase [Curtobacterium sp. P97]MDB6425596.1 TlpA disulfide reductase family protein [Curtobacterium sp. 20TX0008]